MLWITGVVLFVLWALEMFYSYSTDGFARLLLALSFVAICHQFDSGTPATAGGGDP